MRKEGSRRGLFLGVWVLVGLAYFFFVSGWIAVNMHDKTFTEYLSYVVDLAGREHRPPNEIRSLLLVKAESLDIPLRADQIHIKGEGRTLDTDVEYEADVRLPVLNRVWH